MNLRKKLSLYIQATFYLFAGINHFYNPEFYYGLIPEYLPYHQLINNVAGLIEIVFGVGLIYQPTRNWAAYGIIAMLFAFVPSHVYFIQIGGCVDGGLCTPIWIGWVRLIIIHPLLIGWAFSYRNG
jgi:uncharacterized membrane protein